MARQRVLRKHTLLSRKEQEGQTSEEVHGTHSCLARVPGRGQAPASEAGLVCTVGSRLRPGLGGWVGRWVQKAELLPRLS